MVAWLPVKRFAENIPTPNRIQCIGDIIFGK